MRFVASLAFVIFGVGTALLTACAGPQGASGARAGRSDIVTESDESELRRRARLRLELAAGYFEQGQINVALDEIKQSLATDPSYVDAHNLRGLVYMRLNNVPLAEQSFRDALALNPRDADVAQNYGWLLCQQNRFDESFKMFDRAANNPTYGSKAKTMMTLGVCQARAGRPAEAEKTLMHAYELDAGNPVTGYNLASLLYERNDLTRAQFYIRRINNSDLANAETLWLGVKTELKLNNRETALQLGEQLKKRFGQSPQAALYDRGAFNE
ncbi:MAG: type IV pilus biogenesis/stability protein PilW [Polaromonas sp. 39-63-203]|jgi:type IV pilus assembly protein PilF|uniref:type IV pilus biogenesis/stability protein PilW n=1 Tax=Polaromonas sp. TaxID=1869339 RepID=UPI000BD9DD78|nr:type IV pilus biogenesis/stability protein PilW [Polaromonas sp.]OYY53060.1 MAG: type IV pilus biogenesis/stability protein PilW [Polaromonas sp. 35-63-240]OYZ02811.1 MAG: type IV pilus biogenesis/stability protein PilW [Polaromonas sp. 28-63-22]OYZ84949.1 MAG: type IV pilus biogenesis/stability protein PilW [Polaromonas sp. 24-62-144]OZB02288.1 MAG: type IV pilus biogenesis/stability protein PilW [Polaromonas sp. 39-63-203]HQS30853.1 type IV pilus biogenesis/stability protein PilW [Polarom